METAIVKKEKDCSSSSLNGKHIDSADYSIYNYMRSNTGFAIATVSGVVAVTSFIFKYTSVLYNHAYLRFWNIDTAYARQEDVGVVYTALGVFIYYCLMMFAQYLVSNTVRVYKHHNKVFLVWKNLCKKLKKKRRTYRKLRRRQMKRLQKMPVNTPEYRQLSEQNAEIDEKVKKMDARISDKKTMRIYKARLTIHVALAFLGAVFLCFIGSLALSLNYDAEARWIAVVVLSLLPTFLSITLYSLKRWRKAEMDRFVDEELPKYKQEIKEDRLPLFPAETLFQNGIKYFLTNKTIAMLIIQYVITIAACVFVVVSSGNRTANKITEFPLWTDGVSTYAVIYNNGEHIIMEGITLESENATIDTSVQRIVGADDISYEIRSFEKVYIVHHGGEDDAAERPVSGTECQSAASD